MENQILQVSAGHSSSMVIRESEIWLSQNNVKSLEKFEKAVNNTGMLKSAYSVTFTSIQEVSYNEASESAQIKFINEKGKEKKLKISFDDKAFSNQFGQYLGEKLNYAKSTKQEGQIKPLLTNAFYLLLVVGGTLFLGLMDDTSELTESSSSRRSRNKGAFLKMIVDTIGQTGVFVIGGLISIYLLFQLFKRFKSPSTEVVYAK